MQLLNRVYCCHNEVRQDRIFSAENSIISCYYCPSIYFLHDCIVDQFYELLFQLLLLI
jgi:hypothetical protein